MLMTDQDTTHNWGQTL